MREEMESVKKTRELLELRDYVLDGMDLYIYVTDMSSHEILYANKKAGQSGGVPIVGMICWKALKSKNKRCEDCPITYLLKNPGKSYQKEIYNDNRRLKVHDSIIPWLKGRLVHLHYALDITE